MVIYIIFFMALVVEQDIQDNEIELSEDEIELSDVEDITNKDNWIL